MSLLSKALHGIHLDGHTFGNILKNVSPALAFTPLGLAGTGIATGLGEIGRGKHSLGDIAKSVGSNVAIGAGARGLAGHYGVLGQGGPGAVPPVAGPNPAATDVVPTGNLPLPSTPDLTTSPFTPKDTRGALGRIGSGLSSVGHFAADHDKTTSAVLGGLSNLTTSGAQNRAQNAQAKLLESQAQASEYDIQRKKAQDLALEPLRQALYGRLATGGSNGVASNPYAMAGA